MAQSLKRQAVTLTLANAYTRALGFGLRLITARLMGAETVGVMELASSASMLALTPVTAGIPTAMARLTAKASNERLILKTGIALIRRISLVLIPLTLLLSPALSWLLGDPRTLLPMLTLTPTIVFLGLCAVYSGWSYGRGDALTPACCECAEQTIRCAASVGLLLVLSGMPVAVTASLPGIAEVMAGIAVWFLFRSATPSLRGVPVDRHVTRQLIRLSVPTTASRLCQTALRTLNNVLLPVCLRRSGLTSTAVTAQFGLLNGMAMPLMMLPGIVTSAICMVATPAVSRQEASPPRLKKTMRALLLSALAIGLMATAALFFGADFLSVTLYGEEALAPLLRLLCPSATLFALQQVQFGLVTGLGVQRRALTGTIASSAVTLIATAALCVLPQVRIFGAALALLLGSLIRVIWNQAVLILAIKGA